MLRFGHLYLKSNDDDEDDEDGEDDAENDAAPREEQKCIQQSREIAATFLSIGIENLKHVND